MSYPLATALAAGIAIQLALAFVPGPGWGPSASGLPGLQGSTSGVADILAHNLPTLALIAVGALVTARAALAHPAARPDRRMLAYLVVLAVAAWVYFSAGVDWLAGREALSRAGVTFRLVHGYLEWPALLLPWAGVAFAITPQRRLDLRIVAGALACSLALLVAAAVVEATLVPSLLGASA